VDQTLYGNFFIVTIRIDKAPGAQADLAMQEANESGRESAVAAQAVTVPAVPTTRIWMLLAPILFFLVVLAIAALAVLRMSFGVNGQEWRGWTLANYVALLDPYFLHSLVLTLRLAAESVMGALVLAIPVAIAMARTRSRMAKRLLLAGVLLPLLVNLLLQGYGWLILLGPAGVLNRLLTSLHIVTRPVMWLYHEQGVLLGLVQTAFPLAVLPLASAIRAVSISFEEAAATMGASRWEILYQIVLPLAMPGFISAAVLVFAYNASAFAVPLLLGGGRVPMLAIVIRNQVAPLLNWPAAAASGVILMAATLGIMALSQTLAFRLVARRSLS